MAASIAVGPQALRTVREASQFALALAAGLAVVRLVWPLYVRALPLQIRGEEPFLAHVCWWVLGLSWFAVAGYAWRTRPLTNPVEDPLVLGYFAAIATMFYRIFRWLALVPE